MREIILATAIAVSGFTQAQAMTSQVPTTYPAPGVFCGFLQMCEPKATSEKPKNGGWKYKAKRIKK